MGRLWRCGCLVTWFGHLRETQATHLSPSNRIFYFLLPLLSDVVMTYTWFLQCHLPCVILLPLLLFLIQLFRANVDYHRAFCRSSFSHFLGIGLSLTGILMKSPNNLRAVLLLTIVFGLVRLLTLLGPLSTTFQFMTTSTKLTKSHFKLYIICKICKPQP